MRHSRLQNQVTIPTIIDDVKKQKDFDMTRCTYFSIQCDTPSADLALTVQKIYVSALIMIISGIIYCPVDGSDKFDYPEKIEKIFDLPSFFSNAILRKQELIFKTKNPFLILFFYHMLTVITLRG
jgi:hypothetical protein